MKEEFDLDNLKREMPYQVPAGFFAGVTQATLQEAKRREAALNQPKPAPQFGWQVWSVAASIAVLLVAGYLLWKGPQPVSPEMAQQARPKLAPAVVKDTLTVAAPLPTIQEKQVARSTVKITPPETRKQETSPVTNQPVKVEKAENLENLLATLTDEEVAELAGFAASESFVYEETLL